MAVTPAPILTSLAEAAAWAQAQRDDGRTVVLTNGHFDLLHSGHATYLQAARRLGDVLIVGVNDDASAAALKGPERPLVPEGDRAVLLSHLRSVDCVVIFPQRTADALLESVRPHIYAKGGDYTPESLPEAATARAVGARVVFIPLVPGRSTTDLLHRIRSRTDT